MKIISKHKDYYDYLQGIWGVDDKLVLDRTGFTYKDKHDNPKDHSIQTFFICDYQVQGMWMKGKLLYGEELLPYIDTEHDHRRHDYSWMSRYKDYIPPQFTYVINLPDGFRPQDYTTRYILKEPLKVESISPNETEDCPILIKTLPDTFEHYPILSEYAFHKVYSPEEIWHLLVAWLGKRNDKPFIDTRTDKEKILSNGFDTKTSFRKM